MSARPATGVDMLRLRLYWAEMEMNHLLATLIKQSRECYNAPRAPTRIDERNKGAEFTDNLSASDLGDGLQDLGDGCFRHLMATNSDGECPDPNEDD